MVRKAVVINEHFDPVKKMKFLRTKWKSEVPERIIEIIKNRINQVISMNEGGIIPVATGKLKKGLKCKTTGRNRLGVFSDVNYAQYANYPYTPHYYPASQYGQESKVGAMQPGDIPIRAPGESSSPYFFEKIIEKIRNETRNLLEPTIRNTINEAMK